MPIVPLAQELDPLVLSQWQFGLTTVYHFLFVPITLGMVWLTAGFQTAWVRTGNVEHLRLTHFFGKLFLINFAIGVATGIVQEFQFGMNWSDYSRFIGDVFGAPLAFEGLIAFFFEATFIGLWIFGWNRLSPKVHLLTIYMTALGTMASAYFILAANAFMQNPVGFVINEDRQRAELTDIGAVLTNPVALASFPHTMFASVMVAGAVMVGVSAWHLKRGQHTGMMHRSLRVGLWSVVGGGMLTFVTGDMVSLAMVAAQPMKMAAAEALYDTASGYDASFSLFSLGTPDGEHEIFSVRVPYLLALLSTHDPLGTVEGINDLQAEYTALWGEADYTPIIWVTYWSFRWMMGLGFLSFGIALVGLWLTRKGRVDLPRWVWTVAIWSLPLPLLGMTVGWIFTEMGRQPWLVFSQMRTEDGVSPGVTGAEVLTSLIAFTFIYGILGVIEFRLMQRAAQRGPADAPELDETGRPAQPVTVY
ncbi:cytochrome ubiquinol oxidase subunit I [Agrococcus sp. BE272]|uniref:cytochrome ubiquinol oxidase subunit I n=1 Tax=Agrococcus sp. BE272 TaxID=2817727 RepID=UPI0028542E56|nr:cytochrome ubiquinol oxidase subunit I [Agrococcus sp. BE272]MDR7234453.1 cytochrome d ubiquinol oxidase subunit I [Agrococcus sp. BE272]